jgi:uncharacterized protein YjbI with pentapeptide repeats
VPQCCHYEICGLDALGLSGGFTRHCILHTDDPDKDRQAFDTALSAHRQKGNDDFSQFVFPNPTDFANIIFANEARFVEAKFLKEAYFHNTVFSGGADFSDAQFLPGATFSGAKFLKASNFSGAKFGTPSWPLETLTSEGEESSYKTLIDLCVADFFGTRFDNEVNFAGANFRCTRFGQAIFGKHANFTLAVIGYGSSFIGASFHAGADFISTTFKKDIAFSLCSFLGRTIFSQMELHRGPLIFSEVGVNFTEVTIDPLDAVIFRGADLRKCSFRDTDVRGIEFTGVLWPTLGRRLVVYDEIASPYEKERNISISEFRARSLFRIEKIYRQLKQNYQERCDHERVSEFHYGEKEMRRKNPTTGLALRCFLTLYWLLSGYGERYLRPLISAAILLVSSTFLYLKLGLHPKDASLAPFALTNTSDWLRAGHYSFRVMTLLKPDDLIPSDNAQWINTIQSILGPVLFGLFALALRQRLKR